MATLEDITESVKAQKRIEYLAHHDPLTGLPNRVVFREHLAISLEHAAHHKSKLAVISIDLDRFKEVNDVFGHAAGDRLLNEVARRLKDASGGAFVARLGGDEFSLVSVDEPQPAMTEELATRLQAARRRRSTLTDISFEPGLSIGVAIYPSDGFRHRGAVGERGRRAVPGQREA